MAALTIYSSKWTVTLKPLHQSYGTHCLMHTCTPMHCVYPRHLHGFGEAMATPPRQTSRLFTERMSSCSMARSVQMPAQCLSDLWTVCKSWFAQLCTYWLDQLISLCLALRNDCSDCNWSHCRNVKFCQVVWYKTSNYIKIWQKGQNTCTLYTLNCFSRGCSFFQVLKSFLAFLWGISGSVDIRAQLHNLFGFVDQGYDRNRYRLLCCCSTFC